MNAPQRRTIIHGGFAARQELTALLTNVWVTEAASPSKLLVIAAPVLNNSPALDNRAGGFSGLEPGWGERVIRLSELVLRVLAQGGEAWLVARTHPDGPNRFLARVRERAAELGFATRLRIAEVAAMPAAGVFGDGFVVTGPIAFLDAGPDFTGESVVFEVSPTGNARAALQSTFGGLLS